jgi:UDP-glucose 4-epimerase
MRLLVYGGSGLIGRHVVDLALRNGAQVCVASRRRPPGLRAGVRWIQCDITNSEDVLESMRSSGAERVLLLAALLQFECDERPEEAIRVNVGGTANVLGAARICGVTRVVFGSSIAVYGKTAARMVEVGWEYGKTGLYGVTKLLAEALGSQMARQSSFEFIALRYSAIIGPSNGVGDTTASSSGMSLVRQNILKTASGCDVTIADASGEEMTHVTHVSDASDATWRALTHASPQFDVYNVAGPSSNYVSLRDLHRAVAVASPRAGMVTWGRPARSSGPVDTSRIANDLGFIPRVQLADAIRDCLTTTHSAQATS